METGYDVIELPLPAVITVVKEINEPRLPSLRGQMRAKKYEPTLWTSSDLDISEERIGLKGSPTQVIKIFTPEIRKAGEHLEGDPEEVADKLFQRFKEAKIIP